MIDKNQAPLDAIPVKNLKYESRRRRRRGRRRRLRDRRRRSMSSVSGMCLL